MSAEDPGRTDSHVVNAILTWSLTESSSVSSIRKKMSTTVIIWILPTNNPVPIVFSRDWACYSAEHKLGWISTLPLWCCALGGYNEEWCKLSSVYTHFSDKLLILLGGNLSSIFDPYSVFIVSRGLSSRYQTWPSLWGDHGESTQTRATLKYKLPTFLLQIHSVLFYHWNTFIFDFNQQNKLLCSRINIRYQLSSNVT